jgi:hypothetical protein
VVVPEIVGELHCGIAEGIVEASGGGVEVTDLVAHNPRRADRTQDPGAGVALLGSSSGLVH